MGRNGVSCWSAHRCSSPVSLRAITATSFIGMYLPAADRQYSLIWILSYFLLFYFNIAQLAVNLNTFGYAN